MAAAREDMLRVPQNLYFYLIFSALLHLVAAGILWILLPVSSRQDAFMVQTRQGFSIQFESSPREEASEEESTLDANSNGGQENSKKSATDQEGLLTESVGKLRQSIPYPALARSQEIEGTVVVHVRIADGRLESARLIQGSGYDILDNQVLGSLRSWHWPSITAEKTFEVTFQLLRQ